MTDVLPPLGILGGLELLRLHPACVPSSRRHCYGALRYLLLRLLALHDYGLQGRESLGKLGVCSPQVDANELEVLLAPGDLAEWNRDLRNDLHALIERLPARHQALIHLRYEVGLTPEEAAAQLGYQVSSLKKTMSRCLRTLRKRLGNCVRAAAY